MFKSIRKREGREKKKEEALRGKENRVGTERQLQVKGKEPEEEKINESMSLVFVFIMNMLDDWVQIKSIFSAMKKRLPFLHHKHQSFIALRIFTQLSFSKRERKGRRRWRFLNNRSVKMLMK